MEDLRRFWKVPYIVYFCSLFENKLDLVELRIDEFEEAIIDDCGFERNIVVIHLLQKLLKAFVNKSIDLTNYESILLSVLKKYNIEQLFLQSKEENQWSELSMLTKLDIIYNLCEFRLQLSDTELKINEYEPNDLRIKPLGIDSNGNTLWYFGDLRLYEEKPAEKKVTLRTTRTTITSKIKSNKKEQISKLVKKNTTKVQSPAKTEVEEFTEESKQVVDEKEVFMNELKTWSCICLTLDDWTRVIETYKNSKKKPDQEIAAILAENYLPEMPGLFQKAEKERMQRLLAMAPKRQSQRLQVKQQQSSTSTTNFCYSEYLSDENEKRNHRTNLKHLSTIFGLIGNGCDTSVPITDLEKLTKKNREKAMAKHRKEREKQRLIRRELDINENELLMFSNNEDDSQASNLSHSSASLSFYQDGSVE